eukprot:9479755-Pyramimonas_sp.AAC.1
MRSRSLSAWLGPAPPRSWLAPPPGATIVGATPTLGCPLSKSWTELASFEIDWFVLSSCLAQTPPGCGCVPGLGPRSF